MGEKKNNWKKMMVIALALCFGSMIIASILQSAGGKVEVKTLRIGVGDGHVVEVLLFKPRAATADKPAPLVIFFAGRVIIVVQHYSGCQYAGDDFLRKKS